MVLFLFLEDAILSDITLSYSSGFDNCVHDALTKKKMNIKDHEGRVLCIIQRKRPIKPSSDILL